ncbi:arginine repressor [Vagococcus hydrophili]|uniref:Arginine repressor n=1 Tax=Vagococcus hydrophili TaxID=2714947 RepID=A0A6G8ASD0_9ENTE|nr:ArgR family transcriptional regulator [Vagococcus hydrophili]QIL47981.1 ArgR family transcriptional regulator [Vagococcus hydrophili]
MYKSRRQAIIKRMINENHINNQTDLIDRLAKENIKVTQATISRDIRELNIVKNHDNKGNFYYQIMNDSALGIKKRTDEERLIHALTDTGVSLTQVEFTNILTVLPGNGQVIGVLLDSVHISYTDIVGCIAGDDTILILSRDQESAEKVNHFLKQYLYLN